MSDGNILHDIETGETAIDMVPTLFVEYTPANIVIERRKEFEEQINKISELYSGYKVTVESIKYDKATRAELNKLTKAISDRRISIKNEFNQPLKEFEDWVKKASKPLTDAVAAIDAGIKEVEENVRKIQADVIRAELAELVKDTEIDARIFEEKIAGWCKMANFTDSYEIKPVLMDSLTYVVDNEKQRLAMIEANSAIITAFALDGGLSDTPYLSMLKQGQDVNYILELLNNDIKADKAKKEAEAKRKAEIEARNQELASQQLAQEMGVTEPEPAKEKAYDPHGIALDKPLKYQLWFEFASVAEKDLFKTQLFEMGYDRDAHGVFKKMEE